MVYQWKIPMKVSADDAAAELDRIYKQHGSIDPQVVVDESRAETATLHSLFDWDDASAAEKYRVTQARFLIRNIVKTEESLDGPVTVRSFAHVDKVYVPTTVAMKSVDMRAALLQQALNDFEDYRARYNSLVALAGVFETFDEVVASFAPDVRGEAGA